MNKEEVKQKYSSTSAGSPESQKNSDREIVVKKSEGLHSDTTSTLTSQTSENSSKPAVSNNKRKNLSRSTKSAVRQYNILIVLVVVFSFAALALVYGNITQNSAANERINQMVKVADTVQDVYSYAREDSRYDISNIDRYLDILSKTLDTHIWVYKSSGRISYLSSIPDEARKSIRIYSDMNVYLPETVADIEIPEEGIEFTGGNLFGLFQDTGANWLTVIRPLEDARGEQNSYLMLNYHLQPIQQSTRYLWEGIFIVLLISMIVSAIVIATYTKRISEPIENLSETAEKVANGDLSARVDIAALKRSNTVSSDDNDIIVLARTFNRMIEQIESSSAEQNDFIASISHDLRTPLTSIKGFVGAIVDGTIPQEKQAHYLNIIQNETNRLSELVRDMNEVMSLDSEVNQLEFEEFNLNELIFRTIEGTELIMDEKQISVQTNIKRNSRKTIVYGDEQQIERVIYNLVTNAIKFVPHGRGIISISIRPQNRDILIVTIEDNGPGIEQEKLAHIFDKFYKADHSRTGNNGSGLGLYICKRILQLHGQQIFAGRSETMRGAKFEFTLPLIR